MHIEEVIDLFDEHLDHNNEPVRINGLQYAPSEVLNSFCFEDYLSELDKYIATYFKVVDELDGEQTYYINIG